jgi:hypothetical protein
MRHFDWPFIENHDILILPKNVSIFFKNQYGSMVVLFQGISWIHILPLPHCMSTTFITIFIFMRRIWLDDHQKHYEIPHFLSKNLNILIFLHNHMKPNKCICFTLTLFYTVSHLHKDVNKFHYGIHTST